MPASICRFNQKYVFLFDSGTYKNCFCLMRVKRKDNLKSHCIHCPNADGRNIQSKEDDAKAVWRIQCPTGMIETLGIKACLQF